MWKTFTYTLLVEICLFGIGLWTVPVWLSANVIIWLPIALTILLVMFCREQWPTWMQFSRKAFWSDLEVGGRYYRDLMSEYGMKDAVRNFDSMSSPHPDQPTFSPVASAFRWIVQEAINEGKMEVWGTPENGSRAERLTRVEDDGTAYRAFREGDAAFLMMDGVYYRDLQIKRSTIKSYAQHVRADHAAFRQRTKS